MRAFQAIDIDYIEAVEHRQIDRFPGDPPQLPERLTRHLPQGSLYVVVATQPQKLGSQAVSTPFITPEVFSTLQVSKKTEGRALVDSCLDADFVQRQGGTGVLKQVNNAKCLGEDANRFALPGSAHG